MSIGDAQSMKILRINRTNTIIYCDRWDKTVRFYRDIFNLPISLKKTWFVEFQLVGDACLSVADAAHASIPSAAGAGITLSWQVQNIDAIYNQLVTVGVRVTPIKAIWGSRTCFVFDPEGNRIELWS